MSLNPWRRGGIPHLVLKRGLESPALRTIRKPLALATEVGSAGSLGPTGTPKRGGSPSPIIGPPGEFDCAGPMDCRGW